MYNPQMNIKFVKGVGEARAKFFNKLGVETVGQLLRLFPRDYIDFANTVSIANAPQGENCCIRAFVDREPTANRIRAGMIIYKTIATDGESIMSITIFNNKYLAQRLKPGVEYCFYGKVVHSMGRAEMSSPIVEEAAGAPAFMPIYPLTAGLTSKGVANVMRNALRLYNNGGEDILDDEIRNKYKLCSSMYAYTNIHFPKSKRDIEIAKKRLIFEELLTLQLGMFRLKKDARGTTNLTVQTDYTDEFSAALPFEMTNAQKRSVNECVADMQKNVPMNRLLQGDVGSGKTAVAAAVIYSAVKNGMQCAMMAPTEILATQHFSTLSKFFESANLNLRLLSGSTTAAKKRKIKEELKNGEIDVLIGTHAIIQDDVEFSNLGLVITDEQHRFGVNQRGKLSGKGYNAHTLVMSATPIPRTLALIIYGDLDISVLNELPPGRQKISTYCVDSTYHKRIYTFIKKHLDAGLQAYIVCPMVEQNEMELASATEYKEKLENGEFKGYRVGLLHGKMKPKEKDAAMSSFCSGEIQLLVCTTVVEVGVDVPNAVIMLVENAERFGLSQLHQLRGRVGRGKEKSNCILVTDAKGEEAKRRMDVMCKTNDGFRIADEDLKLRGPGDFFGARQHGLPDLKISDMLEDVVTLNMAQEAAKEIITSDPSLSAHRLLKNSVDALFSGLDLGNERQ